VIRVGTCGWADKTLLECGRFYPPEVARDPKKRLAFYAARFGLVEVDSSYYAIPTPAVVAGWAETTPASFTFDVKAFGLLTGHRTKLAALPRDLRGAIPAAALESGSVDARSLPPELVDEAFRRFELAVEPLARAGKLGVLLFQYPPWFSATPGARATLATLRRRLPAHDLAVEFRNARWLAPDEQGRTLALLRDLGLDYVSVDEPQGFPSSVPPVAEVTGKTAIVRFHGRNRDTWMTRTRSAAERMNWDYTKEELSEWVPRVRALARQTGDVHVLMNNCHEDKAVRSAVIMEELLELPLAAP
jgi:uncharacterized protein YecE (DUF72 family)